MSILKNLAFVIVVLVSTLVSAHAAVPPVISYQGKLMQPSGVPVPDGNYSIQFAIYDVPTGGNSLWSETNANVQIKGGLFSVLLGSVINLPANIFDNPDRFFGVKVSGDPEMMPRQKIASVAYAVKAGLADVANTVPDGAITADKLAVGVAIPPGGVIMWSGAANAIPQGWKLCDGTNGTPNLKDKFIVGAGGEYAVGDSGGFKEVALTIEQMPSHSHYFPVYDQILSGIYGPITMGQMHNESNRRLGYIPTATEGGNQPHENRPPYYALCFIMKQGY